MGIDAVLDRPMNPSDYLVTVRYTVANKQDTPREVNLNNFDFLYVDVSAERISRAVRNDICALFGLPPSFGEFASLAFEALDSFLLLNDTTLSRSEIISHMIAEANR